MSFYRLNGVMGATGIKAAMISQQRAEEILIAADQGDQQLAHS
jgi:hypothetical protein